MSCTPKPMIHSCDTGQQILFSTVQYTTYLPPPPPPPNIFPKPCLQFLFSPVQYPPSLPPPPPLPKTFCLSIVSNFSLGGCNTQEKWMQNFRGQKRCLTGDVQVEYSKLNTDCTCLRLWAHSTSTNIKRWTNGQRSQPKVIGCIDNHYFLPLVLHWVHFAHRRVPLK